MTFERLSALAKMVRRYQGIKPYENVVILIRFDQLSDLRAKCVKSLIVNQNYQEYFMGCQLIKVQGEHDYLAVAYETHGCIYNKQEVKT